MHASNTGWGTVPINDSAETLEASGSWSPEESSLHINAREMLVVQYDILSFSEMLKKKVVLFVSDSATMVAYVSIIGGSTPSWWRYQNKYESGQCSWEYKSCSRVFSQLAWHANSPADTLQLDAPSLALPHAIQHFMTQSTDLQHIMMQLSVYNSRFLEKLSRLYSHSSINVVKEFSKFTVCWQR